MRPAAPRTPEAPEPEGPPCKEDPRAPHGFLRDESHNAGRYVCECEHWSPPDDGAESPAQSVDSPPLSP